MNYTNLVNFKYLWVSYYKLKPKEFGSYFPFHALPFIKGQRILNFIPNAKLIEILLRILNNQTKTHIPMRYYTQAILLHYNYSRNTKSLYAIFVRKRNSKAIYLNSATVYHLTVHPTLTNICLKNGHKICFYLYFIH